MIGTILRQYPYALLCMSLIGSFLINILPLGETSINEMINLVLQTLAGINLLARKHRVFILIPILVLMGIAINQMAGDLPLMASLSRFLYMTFFIIITVIVLADVIRSKMEAGVETIFAALSGFMLIGYVGFFMFASIEIYSPGSFHGLSSDLPGMMNDLFYYSFISILTVGYGDIVAVSWVARNASIFMDLMGAIYNLVFMARIVSDFSMSRKRQKEKAYALQKEKSL